MKIPNSLPMGCLVGCSVQVVFFLFTGAIVVLSTFIDTQGGPNIGLYARGVLLVSWGVTQWIALVPLIRDQRRQGNTSAAQGLLLSGCLGVLLSASCAGIFAVGARA